MQWQCPFVLHLVVNGDTIGPADTGIDQDSPLSAIKARPFNTRILAPLCPEQVAAHIHKNTHTHNFLSNQ